MSVLLINLGLYEYPHSGNSITLNGTVDAFIFVGTNFRGLKTNDKFVGFEIRGFSIFLIISYRKSLIRL